MSIPNHRDLLHSLYAEAEAAKSQREQRTKVSAAPANSTQKTSAQRVAFLNRLQSKTSQWADMGRLLSDIARSGIEKVAFEELHGMDDAVGTIPLEGRESFDGGEKVMPVSPEAEPMSLDPGNLSSLDHPATDADGAPVAVRTHALGKDPYHAAAHEVSEVGEAVTKESQEKARRFFAKLSYGRELVDPVTHRNVCRAMGVGTPIEALRMFKRSGARWGCGLDGVIRNLDMLDTTRLEMLYKVSEAVIQDGNPADQIEKCKQATMALVKSEQTLPTAAEVMEVTGCSALAANAAIQEVAEFIAAVNGEVMSADAAAMGAAPPPMPPAMGPADMGMPPQEQVMPPAPMPPPAPPAPPAPPMDPAMMSGAPPMNPAAAGGPPPPGMEVQSGSLEDRIWATLMKQSGEDWGIGDFSDDPENRNKEKLPTGDGHDQAAVPVRDEGNAMTQTVADSAMEMPTGDEDHLEGMFDSYRDRKTKFTFTTDGDSDVSPSDIAGLNYGEAQVHRASRTINVDRDLGGDPDPSPTKTAGAIPDLMDLRNSLLSLTRPHA